MMIVVHVVVVRASDVSAAAASWFGWLRAYNLISTKMLPVLASARHYDPFARQDAHMRESPWLGRDKVMVAASMPVRDCPSNRVNNGPQLLHIRNDVDNNNNNINAAPRSFPMQLFKRD